MKEQTSVYFSDTYLFEAEATVIAVGQDEDRVPWIAVSPNIFHPRGGGQMEDSGTVEGREVTVARHGNGLVILSGAGEIETGTQVRTAIDRPKRLLHAALHTAGHLIGFLGEERGWKHSGHSHFPGQARLDFHPESVPGDFTDPDTRASAIRQLQTRLEALIETKAQITSSINAKGIRTVVIAGINAEPCGGTHVSDVGVLREARILDARIKRGTLKVRYEAEHA